MCGVIIPPMPKHGVSRFCLSFGVIQGTQKGHIVSVCPPASLSVIVARIGVGPGPLEVEVISRAGQKAVRYVVVFDSRVHLNDVTTFSSNIHVVDLEDKFNRNEV